MPRLTHSPIAYRRKMQMTGGLFAFVEGHDIDPNFYDNICASLCKEAGVGLRIIRASSLKEGGGKQVLIEFFQYLQTIGGLTGIFKNKRFATIFFLDKDVDDFLGKKIRSDHVVYTKHYCVENHIFCECNLAAAAAAASSLEMSNVALAIGDQHHWLHSRAVLWKEWLILCLFAHKYGVKCSCTFGVNVSPINTPLDTPVTQSECERHKNMLFNHSQMTAPQFRRRIRAVERTVERLLVRSEHDRVFKGKWYVPLLEAEIRNVAAGQQFNKNGLTHAIRGAVLSQVDFSGPWTEHFRKPLRKVLSSFTLTRAQAGSQA